MAHSTATASNKKTQQLVEYLGLSQAELNAPVSVEEVRSMCEYLGIGEEETFLIRFAVSALQAPIPKDWMVLKDKQGVPFYCNRRTKKTSYRHPSDEMFMQRVKAERRRWEELTRSERDRLLLQHKWMRFEEEDGKTFWKKL
ncbi:hypothetical protein GUITHDRAFT_104610 [Guillardia theta CCMP2712]|uniref:WW domain-containing protein n=1 Tax=Guillardia theta (strain CCMP2712) TaxID=905079 RepID=L1JMZ1_GUITC|nr:hypothetical protein GUITHDRAFT_104610 [Guillardia theta CCMP2712]EKX49649.1 hypothetical protein GUITHDRAFT_104610 [Guillardia theta CCMP2712]|eukprot:XP_005836629.1 hypothetical protein GUITHDRAFT_104610 [Guillardia theta CCMP2712]